MANSRAEIIADLIRTPQVDVLVIGGGINGIGTYRELALQGVRVRLVERGDFCGACSSAPSRMIHGGLRYLENGEFDLVRESLRERDALLRNVPHMVRPLPTTVPIRKVFSGLLNGALGFVGGKRKPSERGALTIKAGLSLYDLFTRRRRALPRHSFTGTRATRQRWPRLNAKMRFTATYHDAWISHPERLGVEMIRDCEECDDAAALNYAEVARDPSGAFTIRDKESKQSVSILPKVVINATGAWVDETNAGLMKGDTPPKFVGGTKGSHLILDHPALLAELGGHMIYFENIDGRVCIMFPYLGKVLVGSTDIRVNDLDDVRCEDDEVDYILNSLAYVFPSVEVRPDQIVYRYSGVRPLPRSDDSFTGRISRDHFTRNIGGTPPMLTMVGGKWTTFRAFGQQSADMTLDLLGHARRLDTLAQPIGGGANFNAKAMLQTLRIDHGVSTSRAEHLLGHYGSTATRVAEFCSRDQDDRALSCLTEYTTGELRYLIRHEYVRHLDDLLQRRCSLAITGVLSREMIDTASGILAHELGWSEAEAQAEITDFLALLDRKHGLGIETLTKRDTSGRKKCA
ncbi:glycerol-3-phosphate dehydrogenase/oxidase [Qingshengfaniella alkalisoli]|uniref:Glycerol-3-phosphate dehydrogenase/oxidase n=1 Tax=Qingshengfaniella alkalisoli TaxID=2599296 RepID=A0A5B8IXQ5_9RHOB|nr:glycerol-3-phosphate dehydrogenase/oxidase [Qingshengfaniella alkalisoli]QDY70514.1 glycerol-3-phosphate dehydrogenase/oxidase [Qingshengfaniella alkalisoli]